MSADETLKKLGLTLPSIPTPVANYVPWKRDGNTIYCSGQGPRKADGGFHSGKVRTQSVVMRHVDHAVAGKGRDGQQLKRNDNARDYGLHARKIARNRKCEMRICNESGKKENRNLSIWRP